MVLIVWLILLVAVVILASRFIDGSRTRRRAGRLEGQVLASDPRAPGHTIVVWKPHVHDFTAPGERAPTRRAPTPPPELVEGLIRLPVGAL